MAITIPESSVALRAFGPPLFEMIGPLPYHPVVQSLFDPALPPGTKG